MICPSTITVAANPHRPPPTTLPLLPPELLTQIFWHIYPPYCLSDFHSPHHPPQTSRRYTPKLPLFNLPGHPSSGPPRTIHPLLVCKSLHPVAQKACHDSFTGHVHVSCDMTISAPPKSWLESGLLGRVVSLSVDLSWCDQNFSQEVLRLMKRLREVRVYCYRDYCWRPMVEGVTRECLEGMLAHRDSGGDADVVTRTDYDDRWDVMFDAETTKSIVDNDGFEYLRAWPGDLERFVWCQCFDFAEEWDGVLVVEYDIPRLEDLKSDFHEHWKPLLNYGKAGVWLQDNCAHPTGHVDLRFVDGGYGRIDASVGERNHFSPAFPRASRERGVPSLNTQYEHFPLSDAKPLLRIVPHNPVDRSGDSVIFENPGPGIWESDDYSTQGHAPASKSYTDSWWTAYNPFTAAGRHSLRRKTLASGPATLTQGGTSNVGQVESKKIPTGWRAGTRICCAAVALCLIIEVILLIWALLNEQGTNSGVLFEGECATVRTFEVWLLLPLNIAATILISTSNYVMQIMTAPSRDEIDLAHRRGLHVLVGGINFNSVVSGRGNRSRRFIWWAIALSSLPIHLLLNVAFYSSVQVSDTGILIVSDDFTNDSTWGFCETDLSRTSVAANFTCVLKQAFIQERTRELSPSQCKSQYTLGFQSNASSLIVVTDANASWYNLPLTARMPDTYGIPCSQAYAGAPYVRNDTSERDFQFIYEPDIGAATVEQDPAPMCLNNTNPPSSTCLTTDDTGQHWCYQPSYDNKLPQSRESTSALFFRQDDPLANISSVRSVFSAQEYRYWASASEIGDYFDSRLPPLPGRWDTSSWVCPASFLTAEQSCDPVKLDISSGWKVTPAALNVKACHIVPKQERCALRYSLKILIITMCCDLVKIAAMIAALRLVAQPLTTLGDIIESFLQRPDPYTHGRCLLDNDGAIKWTNRVKTKAVHALRQYLKPQGLDWLGSCRELWRGRPIPQGKRDPTPFEVEAYDYLMYGGLWWSTIETPPRNEAWNPVRKRWFAVPSTMRWLCFAVLYSLLMIFLAVYFSEGLKFIQEQRVAYTWTIGFGGPDPRALWTGGLLGGTMSITWVAVLVNSPQVLFSMMYFVSNATLTMMHTAREWSLFALQRKALRVSSPRGQQRATYWLQLPWSYSIPLIVASGSLHWLLGRSVYLVRIDVSGYFDQRLTDKDFFACGYSPITVLLLIVVLALMGLVIAIASCIPLHSGIPFARLNSLAIAAACHPNPEEKDIALQSLMWGVIDILPEDGVAHCSFSAREVIPLSKGIVYA